MSCDLAARSLEFSDRRNDCSIKLKCAVKCEIRILFLCDPCSFLDLCDIVMLCRTHCGVGKHRDLRLIACERSVGVSRGLCDRCELFSVRILIQTAV